MGKKNGGKIKPKNGENFGKAEVSTSLIDRDVLSKLAMAYRTGSCWSPVRTLPVVPLWCDLGFIPNSRGNKAAVNLRPTTTQAVREQRPRSQCRHTTRALPVGLELATDGIPFYAIANLDKTSLVQKRG